MVLPLRGGATISARCPLPSGVNRSMTRVVNGIGPVYAGKLASIGIDNFAALAAADADDVAARADLSAERVADWIDEARRLRTQ